MRADQIHHIGRQKLRLGRIDYGKRSFDIAWADGEYFAKPSGAKQEWRHLDIFRTTEGNARRWRDASETTLTAQLLGNLLRMGDDVRAAAIERAGMGVTP